MLREAGFDVDGAAYEHLERYVAVLLDENRNLNLTAARDAETLWRAHVCDSLAAKTLVDAASPQHLLDLGSGGGLPGIPLACVCPELQVTLLDATQKKVAALERIVAAIDLTNVTCLAGRAEEAAHRPEHREQYDVVTARAVAQLAVLIEYTTGFLQRDGAAWFFKSAVGFRAEQEQAAPVAVRCSLGFEGCNAYRLPGDDEPRVLAIYRKFSATPGELPRPAGRARKRPL